MYVHTLYMYIYFIYVICSMLLPKVFVVITALEFSMDRAIY